MKILFITLVDFRSIDDKNLYADLMREFAKKGHDVFIVSPFESRFKIEKEMIIEKTAGSEKQSTILKVKIGNKFTLNQTPTVYSYRKFHKP